jgi:hypothetical protein
MELLQLLEVRAEAEATMQVDTRRQIRDFADEALREAAKRSGDPDRYLAIDAAHEERRLVHLAQLQEQRTLPADADVEAWMCRFTSMWDEAGERATADGFPEPPRQFFVAGARATDVALKQSPLSPPIRANARDTTAAVGSPLRHAAAAELQQEDKLASYRGRPITEMPVFDDGA